MCQDTTLGALHLLTHLILRADKSDSTLLPVFMDKETKG